ncbi:hypothetical protein ABC347_12090 [Sphingomonas sp. 1P06PA]|uniref:hypothetical protein n=1 Tax=Sphingomonas sp. 1P06PA TaxID=554121 RepID=UPI0039A4EB57
MSGRAAIDAVAADARWLAHRFDPDGDRFHMLHVEREHHRAATFITDEYLPAGRPLSALPRAALIDAAPQPAPLHFIFHSAFCCSTLLARAVDLPGVAMGLKEPVVLNDLIGWTRRGGDRRLIAQALDHALTLLARPFEPGEAIVVKPSNIVNAFASVILAMRAESRALLLHAPLRTYLGSVARKGMWGRLWVRELFVGQAQDGLLIFDFDQEQYLRQTDLQIAAIGWLAQHALFQRLTERFGDRVCTLDSEVLTARPGEAMAALSQLFGLGLDDPAVAAIVAGPAFTRHSKFGQDFAATDRAEVALQGEAPHTDEIEKVAIWAEAVAASAQIAMVPPAPLIR